MLNVSFATTKDEARIISKIVDRALGLRLGDRMDLHMDIAATHCNGNPLRLADLLGADEFNFLHDICGINRHLDRETGNLSNGFRPRFSRQVKVAA